MPKMLPVHSTYIKYGSARLEKTSSADPKKTTSAHPKKTTSALLKKTTFGDKTVQGFLPAISNALKAGYQRSPIGFMGGVGALALTVGVGALGSAAGRGKLGETWSYRRAKDLYGIQDRIQAPDIAAKRFLEGAADTAGRDLASAISGGTSRAAQGAFDMTAGNLHRNSVFNRVVASDDVLNSTDPDYLRQVFRTVSNTSPHIASDPIALKSVLREATLSGSGMDYATIKNIAETEKTLRDLRSYPPLMSTHPPK